jgi:hypothetical protein
MTEPKPYGPVLRRTWSVESSRVRVLNPEEERRAARRRKLRSRYGIPTNADLDRRLRALGYAR